MAGQQYMGNVRSPAVWAGDFGGREHIVPTPARLDPTQFSNKLGISVTLTQNASQGATTITVSALSLSTSAATAEISAGNVAIQAGAVLDFGGAKFARVTANASLGATTLKVAALPTALSIGDKATFGFGNPGGIYVPSGTPIGRTLAERDAGVGFGPADPDDDELFLLYNDVRDARDNPDCELYRHGSLVKENFLPEYTVLSTPADEVQDVALEGTLSGGTLKLGVTDHNGVLTFTDTIAWNGTNSTIISNINTALDNALGADAVVAADNSGSAANPHFTLTFSGDNYTGKAQPLVVLDLAAATGATTATVTRLTRGGTPVLTRLRQLYQCIKGRD